MEENDKMNEQQKSEYSKSLMVLIIRDQCWNTKAVTGPSRLKQAAVFCHPTAQS